MCSKDTSKWLVIGEGGVGKTTLYNILTNSTRKESSGVSSETTLEDTQDTLANPKQIEGKCITIIDTPGLGGVETTDIGELIKSFATYNEIILQKIDGLILCARAGRLNFLLRLIVETLQQYIGPETIKYVLVVFTYIDILDKPFENWLKENESEIKTILGPFGYGIFGVSTKYPSSYDKVKQFILNVATTKTHDHLLHTQQIAEITSQEPEQRAERFTKVVRNSPFWQKLLDTPEKKLTAAAFAVSAFILLAKLLKSLKN